MKRLSLLDPRIEQLADQNDPWQSPLDKDLASWDNAYRFPSFAPQPKREPSSDGSVRTELLKR